MKSTCRSQMPHVEPLISHLKKCLRPLLVFFLVGLACRFSEAVPPSTQAPVTPTQVEGTRSPTQTPVPFTLTALKGTSSPTQTQMAPTLVEATASPTLITTPFADLFPKLEVIDVENVNRLQVVAKLPGNTSVVCFSPDGKQLTTGGGEIWDLTSGELSLYIEGSGGEYLSFSPDGKFLFSRASYHPTSNETVTIWDLSTRQRIRALDVVEAAISPDWRVLATLPTMPDDMSSGPYERFIKLTDFERGIQLGVLKDPGNIFDIYFSPDGSKLVMKLIGGDESAAIIVWDVRSRQMITSLDNLLRLDISADSKFAAGASWRPEMTIFETGTWTEVASLSGDMDVDFESPIFTPDSSIVAAVFSRQIKLFETGTWKELAALSAPDHPNFLAFSPDGRLMASYGGSEDKVLLWGVVP